MNQRLTGHSSPAGSKALSPSLVLLALVAILCLAAFLRLYDLNWDDGQLLHPDERHIAMVVQDRISLPFPNLQDAHLGDPRQSTLNPRSEDPDTGEARRFAYGSLPLYLLKAAGNVAARWWAPAETLVGLAALGRVLSALFDLGTVLLTFLMGRRLYGGRAGLVASLLVSLTVLHVQLSHFYAVDTMLTFVLMATLYLAMTVVDRPSGTRVALIGVVAGLALSTKLSAAPVLLPCALAFLLAETRGESRGGWIGQGFRTAGSLLLAFPIAALVFFLFHPYVLMDPLPFLRDIGFESAMVRGEMLLPYTVQYLGTVPVVYQVGNLFFWGAGPALVTAMVAGLGLFCWRLLRDRRPAEWVLAAWLIPYLVVTFGFQVKFLRYMLPALPGLAIVAAAPLVVTAAPWIGLHRRRLGLARLLLALVVLATALQSAAFLRVYQGDHSRVQASQWVYDNVPVGATIATEHWDDRLPLLMPGRPNPYYDYGNVTLPLYDPDTPAKRRGLARSLHQADYLILASNRLYGSIPKVPEIYPMGSAYYALLFEGKLGFEPAAIFMAYPGIGPLEVADDTADESFTVYDHPKVLVFKKTRVTSEQELYDLLPDPTAR
ncbi:MAG: ArnT family glycosyltransferase [Chloroflexota bacterium]